MAVILGQNPGDLALAGSSAFLPKQREVLERKSKETNWENDDNNNKKIENNNPYIWVYRVQPCLPVPIYPHPSPQRCLNTGSTRGTNTRGGTPGTCEHRADFLPETQPREHRAAVPLNLVPPPPPPTTMDLGPNRCPIATCKWEEKIIKWVHLHQRIQRRGQMVQIQMLGGFG